MYLTRNQAGVYSASGVRIPPSPPDSHAAPQGAFCVSGGTTGPHREEKWHPARGFFACTSMPARGTGLYPSAHPDRQPPRQHHASTPNFPSWRPAASCSASPPRCPGREGSRPSLPAEPPMIEFGHLTHVGLRRELNEDTYYGDSEMGLWLVADGMGGHEYGEVASALAREAIVREIRQGTPLPQAIRIADEEIIRASRKRSDSLPMGTTVVAARITGNRFEVAWVGDSRV